MNAGIQNQMVVGIEFSITDERGTVLEATEEGEPFFYIHGRETLLAGIELALQGKMAGKKTEIVLRPENAYGYVDEQLKKTVPLTVGDGTETYEVGDIVVLEENESVDWYVYELRDGNVLLDGNHPWAGKTLYFEIEIVSTRPATRLELLHNKVLGRKGDPGCGPGCNC